MSTASNDEFIAAVEDKFGDWGVVRWWRLLETVAAQMDETDRCHAEYSPRKWKVFLKGSPTKLELLISFFATYHQLSGNLLPTSRKVIANLSATSWRIEIPKLLELRDNHTKNLQAKPRPPLVSKEVEVEVDQEVEKERGGGHETLPPLFDDEFLGEPFETETEEPAPPPAPDSEPEPTVDVQFWRAFSAKVPGSIGWGKGSAAERARENVIRIVREMGSVAEAVDAFLHAAGECDCEKSDHRRMPSGSIAQLVTLVQDQIDEQSRSLAKNKPKGKIFKRSEYVPGKVG